jgi:hypothetical protein
MFIFLDEILQAQINIAWLTSMNCFAFSNLVKEKMKKIGIWTVVARRT